MYPGAFESDKSGISPFEILAQIASAIIAVDFEGVVVFFNHGAERLYNRSAAEMVGHPLSDCYRYEFPNGEDPQGVLEVIRLTGRWSGDSVHIVHDGRQLLVESEVTLFRNHSGEPIGYLAVIRDVTSRREEQLKRIMTTKRAREESVRAWEELRTHGEVLESFLENLPVAAFVKDEQGRYIFHNPAARAIAPELAASAGKTDEDLFGPARARKFRSDLAAVFASKKPTRVVETWAAGGSELSLLTVRFPITGPNGKRYLAGFALDITENVRGQAELRRQAALLDFAQDPIFISDLDGAVTYWNREAERLYGWTQEEARGSKTHEFLKTKYPRSFPEMMELFLREGHWEGEVTHFCRDGSPITVLARWCLLRDEAGAPSARMVVNTDLTELKIVLDGLHQAEAVADSRAVELAAILDAVPAATFIARDRECLTMTSSRAAYEILRLPHGSNSSKSALPQERPTNFRVMRDGRELANEELPVQKAARAGRAFYGEELTLMFDDGTSRKIFGNAVPLEDEKGAVYGAVGAFIDITEPNMAEHPLRDRHAILRRLFESDVLGIVVSDISGVFLDVNDHFLHMVGYTREDLCTGHTSWREMTPAEYVPREEAAIAEARRRGSCTPYEKEYLRKDGSTVPIFMGYVRLEGNQEHFISFVLNLSSQKQAENELRLREEEFRLLSDSIPQFCWMAAGDGEIFWYNRQWFEFTGTTLEEMKGWGWEKVHDPAWLPTVLKQWKASIDTGAQFEMTFPLRGADGQYRHFLTRVSPMRNGEGQVIRWFGTNTDVTAEREQAIGLARSEKRFRELAESLPQLIWVSDAAGGNIWCNRHFFEYTGIAPEEWQGISWKRIIHPEDLASTLEAWNHSLASRDPYLNDYRLRRHDGEYRHFFSQAVPVIGETGELEQWVGSSTDIHDQKLAAEMLRRTEKLAIAERLAASIAHQINNPLAAVTNLVYLASHEVDMPEAALVLLLQADQELSRISRLTSQALRFHRQSVAPQNAEMSEIVDSAFSLFESRFRSRDILVERDYRPHEKMMCNSDDLRHVFINLIANSMDAMQAGAKLDLRIRQSRAWSNSGRRGVRITIADTGHGIDFATRKRLFQPFVSTREETGTGLGLWITADIVHRHQGRIYVRSSTAEGHHGTVFTVFLPYDRIE